MKSPFTKLSNCELCNKPLLTKGAKRCKSCARRVPSKWLAEFNKNNPKRGSKNGMWKGGVYSNQHYCKLCGKKTCHGKTKNLVCINCFNKNKSGKNNPNWQGGITPENKRIRGLLEYKLWRTAVFERDSYTCIWCGVKSGNGIAIILNADHIKPFAHYPELRFAIDNGRTLCQECHKKTDTFAGKTRKLC